MEACTLHDLLGTIECENGQRHLLVQKKLARIGKRIGYTPVIEYKAGVYDGRQDTIDVVWLSKHRIVAAFEVRMRKFKLSTTRAQKDIRKLVRIKAEDRFLINVSRITGSNYVHKIPPISTEEIKTKYPKAYAIKEIRKEYSKAYEKWTLEEEKALAKQYQDGIPISELAKFFQRQPGAIRSRLLKLDLLDPKDLRA